MTTGECANHLNRAAGERVFDDRMMRQRVLDGELACVNPTREPRRRFRITRSAFLAYVEKHHPHLVDRVRQRFGLDIVMFHEERS